MTQRIGLTPGSEGLKFSTDWVSRHTSVWEKHLSRFKALPDVRFLEVGCWEGRSTCWFLQNILTDPSSHITCVDPFTGSPSELAMHAHLREAIVHVEEFFDHNINFIGANDKVTKVKSESAEALRALPMSSFDVIHIDGSHTASDVFLDAALAWLLLKKDGVLMFDDYEWKFMADPNNELMCPRPSIDAFLKIFADKIEVLDIGLQVLVRKIA